MKLYKSFYKAFVFKSFQILSPVLISISHENTIEIPLTSEKRHQAKFCLVHARSQALLFTGKQVFLVGFSLRFPIFTRKSRNRLNTSLSLMQFGLILYNMYLVTHLRTRFGKSFCKFYFSSKCCNI